jgi:hypothetical protein
MAYDFTNAPAPKEFELIPHGTIAIVSLHIKPGGVGEDGMLMRSRAGDCEMLSCELTIIDGQYRSRKVFENWILEGTTDGHSKAIEISCGTIKTILDSAYGLRPDDKSEKARQIRTKRLGELEGLTFIAKIGIEKGGKPKPDGSGNWPDKNILAAAITPDRKDWRPVDQPVLPLDSSKPATAAPAQPDQPATPDWAF